MGPPPFEREWLPVVLDGIEYETDCTVRSCEVIPRPMRTMISEN